MIAVVDYGIGNLGSVEKAFHYLGQEAVITSKPNEVLNACAVVLPGVGAFADGMKRLNDSGMANVIKEVVKAGKPFLGICLGMQLLFEYSEEGGDRVYGLGIFEGAIKQLPMDTHLKVPHMGWNLLHIKKDTVLFRELPIAPYVYFVHSYYLDAKDRSIVAATASYGIEFDVAISTNNVFATQFHPEKSGDVGLRILRNWLSTVG